MIKLEYLRVFATVAETQALSEAAERLGRTPAAVSMTLKQIEATLGGPLFEGERKANLTPLGTFALRHARRAVAEHNNATAAMLRYANGEDGDIRVAAVPSAATRLLPDAVGRLRAQRQSVRIELRDIDSRTVVRAVAEKSAEIGIASRPGGSTGLQEELLLEDPFVLLCRQDHRIAKSGAAAAWSDIDPTEFIANGLCASIREPALTELSNAPKLTVHNVSSLFAFVARGFGVTLLPMLAIPEGMTNLSAVPLAQGGLSRRLFVFTRPGETLSPSAAALLSEIRHTATQISDIMLDEAAQPSTSGSNPAV